MKVRFNSYQVHYLLFPSIFIFHFSRYISEFTTQILMELDHLYLENELRSVKLNSDNNVLVRSLFFHFKFLLNTLKVMFR